MVGLPLQFGWAPRVRRALREASAEGLRCTASAARTAGLWALGACLLAGCTSPQAYYSEGVAHLSHSPPRYDEAIEAFTAMLKDIPDSDLAYVNRGDAYLGLGAPEKAIADYDRAIALMSEAKNPWFYNRRGLVNYQLGRYDRALEDWTAAKGLEEQLRKMGYKVKSSEVYLQMLEQRELLLSEVERLAETFPMAEGPGTVGEATATETATPATDVGEPAMETGEPTVVAEGFEPGTESTPPATTTEEDELAAAAAAAAARDEEAMRAEAAALMAGAGESADSSGTEPSSATGEMAPPATEGEAPFEATARHEEAILEARARHELAALEAEDAAAERERQAAEAAEAEAAAAAAAAASEGEPLTGEPAVGETAAVIDEPTIDEPTIDEPTTEEPAAPAGPDDAQLAYIEEMRARHELAAMDAEEMRAEAARAEAARAEEEAAMAAAAAAAASETPAVEEPAVVDAPETEAPVTEAPVTEAAPPVSDEAMGAYLAEMRMRHEVAAAEAEMRRQRAAEEAAAWAEESAAADREREATSVQRMAVLTGTWVRDDGLKLRLSDDGKKAVGELVDNPYYVFYEVSLEWQDEKTLVGRGVFKEKLTAHQYEAQVGWKMQVEGDRILRCQAEEVGWSEDHQEIYRDWVDYTFTRE